MPDNDTTTPPDGTQDAAASAFADAAGAGSGAGADDASLQSRYAGQTAKVNVLTGQLSAAETRALAAEQKLADYEAGKIGADEALKAQLAAEKKNTEEAKRETALARVEAKYPETFAVLGEDAAGLSEVKLAETEARLRGVAAEDDEAPTPKRHNESRTSTAPAAAGAKAETADDVEARLLSMKAPWAT